MDTLTKFLNARIKANKENFTEDELKAIKDIETIVKKIYMLGFLDGKEFLKEEE